MTDETNLSNTGAMKLRSFVDRIERLEEDKVNIAADLKEIYAEAKGEGFNTAILRKVIKLRSKDAAALQEEQALISMYLDAAQGDLFADDGTSITISAGGETVETNLTQMREASRRLRART